MHVFVVVLMLSVLCASSLVPRNTELGPAADVAAASALQKPVIVARVIPSTETAADNPQLSLVMPTANGAQVNGQTPLPAAVKPAPEIKTYIVEEGDNPYDLALTFNISEETLLDANGLNADSILQIGQKLLVPPTSGVVITTQDGDTVQALADQYKIAPEAILSANHLATEAKLLLAGEPLVLPGVAPAVQIPAPAPTAVPVIKPLTQVARAAAPVAVAPAPAPALNTHVAVRSSSVNMFPWGQCTWWAAQQRPDIGGSVYGNAASWLYSARAAGLSTGYLPRVGAVVVYQPGAQGAAWTGHVAYVTSVSSNGINFTISEMNFPYWGRVTTRGSWTGPGVSFIY